MMDANLADYLDDFGISVTLHPGQAGERIIKAVFDNAMTPVDMESGPDHLAYDPVLTCATSDLTTDPELTEGDSVSIGSTGYAVDSLPVNDGQGLSMVQLRATS